MTAERPPGPRLLVVGAKQETATFSPATTGLEMFEVMRGADATAALTGTRTEYGGLLDAAAANGAAVEFGTVAWAPSGGRVDGATWQHLRTAILDDVVSWDGDAVIVVAHGAMVCEGDLDPEGTLLSAVRRLTGDLPVVCSLDLHAVVTDAMLDAADVLVPYQTYPHVDHYETGTRALSAALRLLAGTVPATAFVRVPLLARGDELLTATGILGALEARCTAAERAGALAAGVFIGNPFTDVPDLSSGVLVVTDADLDLAERTAESVATQLWEARERLRAELEPIDTAVAATVDAGGAGPFVLADQADATSSGSTGDATALLRALLTSPSGRPALVSVVDAPAAQHAVRIGAGATATFRLGGTVDRQHEPLEVQARVVRADADGEFAYEDGTIGRPGATAVLEVDDVWILVTSRAVWVVGQNVYRAHGLDPAAAAVVVVKSPNGYRPYYESVASRMLPVDGVGATSAALERLAYERVSRPIWPLDRDLTPDLSATLLLGRRRVTV